MKAKDAIACAKEGDVNFFKTVVPDILLGARDEDGDTVLTVAALCGHLDCCEVIVERCTPLLYHQKDYTKCSVLHNVLASDEFINRSHQDKYKSSFLHDDFAFDEISFFHHDFASDEISFLHHDFASDEIVNRSHQNKYKWSVLHENIMKFLITAVGRIPNKMLLTMRDQRGDTALHLAVERGNRWAAKLLIEADRDFELRRMGDQYGRTCLHIAVDKDDHVLAELMIKRPDIEFLKMTERGSNETALHVAARKGNLEMAKLICEADPYEQLLSMLDEDKNTPRQLAIINRNFKIAKLLTAKEHMHAITCAESGNADFFRTVILDILLEARDEHGYTLLIVAVRSNQEECCKVIVERCTQLLYHQSIILQWSVLHWVVANDKDNKLEKIMKFLITADADSKPNEPKIPNHRLLTMRDKYNATALHTAVESGNHVAIKLLLKACCDFEWLQMPDQDGQACLHIAAKKGDHVAGELIIKSRPDIEFLPERKLKQTALHIAVENNRLAFVQFLLELDHSNDLLAMVDSNRQTAFQIAVKRGTLEMVKLMVKFICDANLDKQLLSMPDERGNTPLSLASRDEIVRLLTQVDMTAEDAITCAKIGYMDFFKRVAREILHEVRDEGDNTVLNVAAIHGHLDCCQVIVKRCTQLLYHQDKYAKCSVLHDVVAYEVGEDIMRFLITADSQPDWERGGKLQNNRLLTMQNINGQTARDLAVWYRNDGAIKLLPEADH